jgi:hypothetical protein
MSALTATTTAAVAATPALTVEALLSVLRAASADQMAGLLTELNRGMPLWRSPEEGKATSARAKMAARAAAAAALLPEAADGEAPAVSAYRVSAADIDHSVCVGRRLADSTKDTRWKPAVYREFQCGKELSDEEESDLCPTCSARKTRYDAAPGPKVEWMGRITEEPLGWLHMLGTDWASGAKGPKWIGGDGGSDTASVASGGSGATEQMSTVSVSTGAGGGAAATAAVSVASKAEAAAAKAAAKLEEAKAKAAAKILEAEAKAAAKAEAVALKAKEKAEAAALKEKEKAAAAAAKEAEKAAKAAAKEAEKVAKEKAKAEAAAAKKAPKATAGGAGSGASASAKAQAIAAPVAAKAAPASAETAETEGEIKLIGSDLYIVKGGNVYEYDSATEKAGALVGVLNEDGESFESVSAAAE